LVQTCQAARTEFSADQEKYMTERDWKQQERARNRALAKQELLPLTSAVENYKVNEAEHQKLLDSQSAQPDLSREICLLKMHLALNADNPQMVMQLNKCLVQTIRDQIAIQHRLGHMMSIEVARHHGREFASAVGNALVELLPDPDYTDVRDAIFKRVKLLWLEKFQQQDIAEANRKEIEGEE
jgi:hypothetical protein